MRCAQAGAAGARQLFAQRAGLIFGLHQTASLQNWHDPVDKIDEGSRRHHIGEIETINARPNPLSKCIGQLLRRAHQELTAAAQTDHLDQLAQGPSTLRLGTIEERLHDRTRRIGFDIFERLIRVVLAEIDARPAAEQRERPFVTDASRGNRRIFA